jgi:hypothetical protein
LVQDLVDVPNVAYATIRYPGHYDWVQRVVTRHSGDFDRIRAEFVATLPYTRDDVIVVYAEARGRDNQGRLVVETYSNRFRSADDNLTAIQSTTAAGGVAMLELIESGAVRGIVGHTDVTLAQFKNTVAYRQYYFGSTDA